MTSADARVVGLSVVLSSVFKLRHHEAARELLLGPGLLLAPDAFSFLLLQRMDEFLRKSGLSEKEQREAGPVILSKVRSLNIELVPSAFLAEPCGGVPLLEFSFQLWREDGLDIPNAIFLATAIARDVPLVTANRKLYSKVQGKRATLGRYARLIHWIEEGNEPA